MGKQTPLYDAHVSGNARMVDFGGWDMPLHYGSQLEEHHAVRQDAGMFDVSHMTVVDLQGDQMRPFLRKLLANNIDRVTDTGKALYSCMLQEDGGVIDDLIVYFIDDSHFRMVVNAATREKDLAWIQAAAREFGVSVSERNDLAMIAVQGPEARDKVLPLLDDGLRENAAALKPFYAAWDDEWFVGRTGYTGEDGFEVVLPARSAIAFWISLVDSGVRPCGLGARDTLRLEAGMNLYGTDMDESVTPLESGLGWTVGWEPEDREFNGRAVLTSQKAAGGLRKFVGLVLKGRGVLRNHQRVDIGDGTSGEITSGGFSPTLNQSIALARVPASTGETCHVDIRGKLVEAKVVKPPFVRNGKICV